MWQPTQPTPPRANARCPLCDRPVVAGGLTTYTSRLGIMFAPRTRQELIAACPVHGHRSVNDLTSDADTSGSTYLPVRLGVPVMGSTSLWLVVATFTGSRGRV
jgi:hypothetical protein